MILVVFILILSIYAHKLPTSVGISIVSCYLICTIIVKKYDHFVLIFIGQWSGIEWCGVGSFGDCVWLGIAHSRFPTIPLSESGNHAPIIHFYALKYAYNYSYMYSYNFDYFSIIKGVQIDENITIL